MTRISLLGPASYWPPEKVGHVMFPGQQEALEDIPLQYGWSPWPGPAPWLGLLSSSFFPLSCPHWCPPRKETKMCLIHVTVAVDREGV